MSGVTDAGHDAPSRVRDSFRGRFRTGWHGPEPANSNDAGWRAMPPTPAETVTHPSHPGRHRWLGQGTSWLVQSEPRSTMPRWGAWFRYP